jgi:tetratricopeptide (TPR) repeat protein
MRCFTRESIVRLVQEDTMHRLKRLELFSIFLLSLMGCTGATELHRGRLALLSGMPDVAVAHFRQVTAVNENLKYSQLQEGAWTYLGRAYYDAKKYPEARQALDRAVSISGDDSFARLYRGLTLARQGDHAAGQTEALVGLKGLSDWLNYIEYNTSIGIYWDPTREIRGDLEAVQRRMEGSKPNLTPLFAELENLGMRIEREIDLASADESRDRNRRAGGGSD